MGLGTSSVINVDMFCVEFIDENSYKLLDLYSRGLYKLNEDVSIGGKDDLTNRVYSFLNNTYSISFDRLLNTSDPYDFVIRKVIWLLIQGENISLTITSSTKTPMIYKRENLQSTGFFIDVSNIVYLQEVNPAGKIDFYSIKGLILTLCWIFLNFTGITFAAFCKHKTSWIHVHRVCCGLGALLAIIFGFIAIADRKQI
jgi:hypothetical protein